MSLSHSPSIVSNGLVFAYDQNNIKSYKGPVLQNLANAISVVGVGTSTGYVSTALTETIDISGLGLTTVYTNIIQNNYTSYTPNSTNCCPSLHSWGNIAVSPSTLYTYGIVYKCDSGYTGPNYMYRYEYTSNGGAYVTEGGVHSDANRVSLGNGWYYAWGTFTTSATTNWLGYCGAFYYRYSPYIDKLSVAKVLIAAGNWSNTHPKYWPESNTTRSNTQAILDLTNNNPVTANSLTYASDGTFSFNGSSNYASITNNAALRPSTELTIEYVIKGTTPSSWTPILGYGNGDYTNGNYLAWIEGAGSLRALCRIDNSGVIEYRQTSGISVSTSYTFMTFTMKIGDAIRSYNNGVAVGTPTLLPSGGSFYYGGTTSAYQIGGVGGVWLNATVPFVRFYNRALSASEVLQNFNALRGRYGI